MQSRTFLGEEETSFLTSSQTSVRNMVRFENRVPRYPVLVIYGHPS